MPHLPEFIQSFFDKAKNVIGGFLRLVEDKTAEPRGRLKYFLDRLLGRIPLDRRIALTAAAGVLVILVIVITGAALSGDKSARQKDSPAVPPMFRQGVIPAEDVFISDEPDFVPGVLLDREKREQWTVDDAMPWWQDPLKDGEQEWRDQIERTVDNIMESVP